MTQGQIRTESSCVHLVEVLHGLAEEAKLLVEPPTTAYVKSAGSRLLGHGLVQGLQLSLKVGHGFPVGERLGRIHLLYLPNLQLRAFILIVAHNRAVLVAFLQWWEDLIEPDIPDVAHPFAHLHVWGNAPTLGCEALEVKLGRQARPAQEATPLPRG